jgi:hypothetical protein
MTTGKNQPQPLVGQRARSVVLFVVAAALSHADQFLAAIVEAALFSQSIDRLVPRDADDPRARIFRQPVAMPLFDRARERVLRRVFREIEVAKNPNERGEYSSELLAIEALDALGGVVHRHIRPMAG